MAESYIQLAPDSSGKKAHTYQRTVGANTIEDEVVLQGEPYLANYVVVGSNIAITTANDRIFSINAGASLIVRVHRIYVQQHTFAGTVTRQLFRVRRLTTLASGGTALTPEKMDTADAAAGATAQQRPTAGTVGNELWRFPLSLFTVAAAAQQEPIYEWKASDTRKALTIAAGTANGIVIDVVNSVATATVSIWAEFTESNF